MPQFKYSIPPPHHVLPGGHFQGRASQLIPGISEVSGGVRLFFFFFLSLCVFLETQLVIFVQSYPAPTACSHRMFWADAPLWPKRLVAQNRGCAQKCTMHQA